jgi:hypothetical protein
MWCVYLSAAHPTGLQLTSPQSYGCITTRVEPHQIDYAIVNFSWQCDQFANYCALVPTRFPYRSRSGFSVPSEQHLITRSHELDDLLILLIGSVY